MRKLAPIVLSIALLAGCSAAPAQVITVTASAPASAPSPTPTDSDTVEPEPTPTPPATNERGNIPKKLGEWAELRDGNEDLAVKFRVTKIEPGFKCNSGYSDRSANGHYVGVWMEVQTTKAVDFESDDSAIVPYFNTDDLVVISRDGTSENDSEGNGYSCAKDSISLPTQLGPGKKVKGVVVLDTKYKHGFVAMIQDYMESGWEWEF